MELTEEIILTKFNHQFIGYYDKAFGNFPIMYGLEVPTQWYEIVYNACLKCEEKQLPVMWTQIKEKFFDLRMYFELQPGTMAEVGNERADEIMEEISDIVHEAEVAVYQLMRTIDQNDLKW